MRRVRSFFPSARGRTFPRLLPAVLALVAACTVGPDFVRPEVDVPDTWVGAAATPAVEAELARWWTVFCDAKLTSLIEQALTANLDLRIATARVRQARASRGVVVSGIGPALDASGSFRRGQQSAGGQKPMGPTTESYEAGFDAGFEIDIFGGVRRGIEAADAEVEVAVENRRDVLVTLAAEVARDYVDLRAYQQRLAIARKNLESQKRSAAVTRRRSEGGFVSGLDVANAEALVATTEAQIPLLEASARQTIFALSVLLDREPGALLADLSPPAEIPAASPAVPAGVPSDLLRRRPDIRAAEASIHAATARIGVATADLFPKVTIGGSVGWQAPERGDLFKLLSRFWSLGPSVSFNLFASGRTWSNIELANALEEESVLAYRQAVLFALREVEGALVASAAEQRHRQSLSAAVAASGKAAELAMKLYTEGETEFLNVLSAQRSLLNSEDALAQSAQAMAVELIALYKALGGGWEEDAP